MKNFTKKILSGFLALAMIFGMIIPSVVKAQGNTDVVIHKIKMKDLNGWPKEAQADGTYLGADGRTTYNGSKIQNIQEYFGADKNPEELDGVKFIYWEVTKALYEEMMATPDNFKTKEQVKAKVENENEVTNKEGTVTGATASKSGVKVTLANGTDDAPKYYWFIEDIGSNIGEGNTLSDAAAVPFGIALPIYKATGEKFATGDDNALHIYPKNTITKPEIDKNFAQGTGNSQGAEYTKYSEEKEKISRTIGSNIPYHVKTKLPAKAKYKTLRWEDTMDKGLTFNKDVTVKITKVTGTVVESDEFSNPNEYTIVQNESGFVLEFTKAGLEKLIEKLDSSDYEIEFNYSATLNGEAVIDNPEENRIKFDYSNNPKEFKDPRENPTTPKEDGGKYKIEVQKTWANGADTTAPNNIEVTYFLYEKGQTQAGDKVVATHKVTNANFNHTFENLEQNKEYYVKELVKGYDPEYTVTTNGEVAIKNTKDNDNPESLIPTNPKVVTHGKKFVKTDNKEANGATPLLGAEFVVKNNADKYLALKDAAVVENDKTVYEEKQAAYLKAIEDYNKLEKDAQTEEEKQKIETAKAQRDIAFNKVRINYEWTTEETKALKIVSNTKGQFEVTGLEAGNYELKETKAPVGFAKLSENIAFTVGENTYTTNGNIEYNVTAETTTAGTNAMQVKNKKITIPQTGGMGTIIFTAVGITLMGAAAFAMKRRKEEQ